MVWFSGESMVFTLKELKYDPYGIEALREFVERRVAEVTNESEFGWCFY